MLNHIRSRWNHSASWRRWLWPAVIAVSALGVGAMIYWDVQSPLRPVLAFWFLLICPGMALVRVLRIGDNLTELALAAALSLGLDMLVAGAMVYNRFWRPELGLAVLIVLCLFGVLIQLYQARRVALPVEETS